MAKTNTQDAIRISPPNFQRIVLKLKGDAPLVINAFSAKARQAIRKTQEAGSTAKAGKKRDPKDFTACYEAAKHVSDEGWCGIHAAAFRNACISACRACGFVMTHAKLAVFIDPDGFDREDGTPLVKITKGEPRMWVADARNATGVVDLRARPRWDEWGCDLKVRFDADMFTKGDVVNLIARVGMQVGIGEGRPDSKKSAGLGFGLFTIQ